MIKRKKEGRTAGQCCAKNATRSVARQPQPSVVALGDDASLLEGGVEIKEKPV